MIVPAKLLGLTQIAPHRTDSKRGGRTTRICMTRTSTRGISVTRRVDNVTITNLLGQR